MSQKRNKIIILSSILIISALIILIIDNRNSALATVKNFYRQYTNCIENSQMDVCINQLKNQYSNLTATIKLFTINAQEVKDLPINARKLSLASNFYQLPYLKNPTFTLIKQDLNKAEVALSGFLDLGEEGMNDIQIGILKDGFKASYPDFVVSQPLTYIFELSRNINNWKIDNIYFSPPSLKGNVLDFIEKCKMNLENTNQDSVICVVNDNKVSVLSLTFNQAGFLTKPNNQSEALETKDIDDNTKQILTNNLKEGTLIIYLVNFKKLSQNTLLNKGIDIKTKMASLSPIKTPTSPTSFCAVVTPLFKDGMIAIYPNNVLSNNSVWIEKNGYLICNPKINWNQTDLIWGIAGILPNLKEINPSSISYLGIKLYLPPEDYYGKDFNVFDYIQNISSRGQVFYRLAMPIEPFK